MILRRWENLPLEMQTEEIRKYYDILKKKTFSLICKRMFDIIVSLIMLILLSPVFLVLTIAIKADSKGPVFYRQIRITQYGKKFRIFKFRTMIQNADTVGSQVTMDNDPRITRIGKILRKYRLDEIAQLIDVFRGTMTFVGTRPEVPKYVAYYTQEMMATLLLPAGVTSETSIYFKNENEMLALSENIDKAYIECILPRKMFLSLKGMENFRLWNDLRIMFMTIIAVLGVKSKNIESADSTFTQKS
jgi:lipopolysaccharide/colanic/teichoic acid biosynthesis glycosyltransferase